LEESTRHCPDRMEIPGSMAIQALTQALIQIQVPTGRSDR
jgi:hypothetical protein